MNTGEKVFVNVCHHAGVLKSVVNLQAIFAHWRQCVDKSKETCFVVDAIFNSSTLSSVGRERQDFLMQEIMRQGDSIALSI
jgi:hypothetical protein